MIFGMIGDGAIAGYVQDRLAASDHRLSAILMRQGRDSDEHQKKKYIQLVDDFPTETQVVLDCAGHAALREHGPAILDRGIDVITVSLGALADQTTYDTLKASALSGGARLHLASGAIGALDCLSAANVGTLDTVTYVGRKPPKGWLGSPAENSVDLANMTAGSTIHFQGTARDAAIAYPKNANVAAAIALSGLGFDATKVTLIADADVTENIHEVQATGAFGRLQFKIQGRSLPGNPKSSALAAMSVISKLEQLSNPITV